MVVKLSELPIGAVFTFDGTTYKKGGTVTVGLGADGRQRIQLAPDCEVEVPMTAGRLKPGQRFRMTPNAVSVFVAIASESLECLGLKPYKSYCYCLDEQGRVHYNYVDTAVYLEGA